MIDCLTPWNLVLNFFVEHSCSEIYNSGLPTDSLTVFEYAPYFLKTYILELPLYFIFLFRLKSLMEIILGNFLLNIYTHPAIFILFPIIFDHLGFNYLNYLIAAEIFAPLVEALVLRFAYKIPLARAFTASIAANLFSWSVGVYWV